MARLLVERVDETDGVVRVRDTGVGGCALRRRGGVAGAGGAVPIAMAVTGLIVMPDTTAKMLRGYIPVRSARQRGRRGTYTVQIVRSELESGNCYHC